VKKKSIYILIQKFDKFGFQFVNHTNEKVNVFKACSEFFLIFL